MAYSIYVIKNPDNVGSMEYLFDEHLGSANSLAVFWSGYCDETFFIIPTMLGRADTEEGFILKKEEFDEFIDELGRLEKRWENIFSIGNDIEKFKALKNVSDKFREAIKVAKEEGVNVEVW